ncbi:MAG: ACP S-malonyltransferase [Acidimicrobiales bacterium]|nr:ACP S-malonyltransferase [Acidimicrobiales bacterium]MDP6901943.1 ACP S-malonyltransferase [Acidimicrobiales bacterium]HJL98329.1 ACP S-malonyltransferase [Acidimicrobiales bacterium]
MLAFTFPGQGSQKPAMGSEWVEHESWELVDEASAACGRDVSQLLLEADADELKQTRNSQLTTFVLSMVVLDAVERTGVVPNLAAGHSLGEYSALCASGALSFEDAVRLVAERGEAMQVAADEQDGTMAAVLGLDDDLVVAACARVDGDVWVANYNAPGQIVIAGSPTAVEDASEKAKELGAKRAMGLPVGGAFHTPFMAPARDRLRKALAEVEVRAPAIPVVANVDAAARKDAEEWPQLLASQLCSPVQWRQSLYTLQELGCSTFVELGPGTVLTGMAKRTLKEVNTLSVATPEDVDTLLATVTDLRSSGQGGSGAGEHLYVTERLVVSPCAGVFVPKQGISGDQPISVGDVVGWVAEEEVRSPFAGLLMEFMALENERVTARQPIAWLRTK